MGQKIFTKKCKDLSVENFSSYESLYSELHDTELCGQLSEKHLEALSLYLWDVKRNELEIKKYPKLSVTKDEKCPVCGMFLYKYPEWICRINYEDESFAFDGIKDMFKYYFEHQENIQKILVQDYYSGDTLEAQKGFYVLGSDVYGPMGNELIAFKSKKNAQTFLLDHRGKEILSFDEITVQKVYNLDE